VQVLAHTHTLLGQPHPVQLRDQVPYSGTRPQLPSQLQVTGTVIQYGLPDRPLLDRIAHLMLADPAPARLGHECIPAAGQPTRPSVVHGLE
jgi:hypothetical protein